MTALLNVQNLNVEIRAGTTRKQVVKDVSFSVNTNEVVAVIGESGSGKSMTANSILGLLPASLSANVSGSAVFDGVDLLGKSPSPQRSKVRGTDIAPVFQAAMTALDPSYSVGAQMLEIMRVADRAKEDAKRFIDDILLSVGLKDVDRIKRAFPHELSGGQRQRILIAIALSRQPKLLIADEPTSALDASVQKQILDIFREVQRKYAMSILIVTHDFGVVRYLSDRVLVMYGGNIVEQGLTADILRAPKHPYTQHLLRCVPDFSNGLPSLDDLPGPSDRDTGPPAAAGCSYHLRCPHAQERCSKTAPEIRSVGSRTFTCWREASDE